MAGAEEATQPILVDHNTYAQPDIVYTWLERLAEPTPPKVNADWYDLINTLPAPIPSHKRIPQPSYDLL
jgi:hypothetical protein